MRRAARGRSFCSPPAQPAPASRAPRRAAFTALAAAAPALPRGFHTQLAVEEGAPYTFFIPADEAFQRLRGELASGDAAAEQWLQNSTRLRDLMRCARLPL